METFVLDSFQRDRLCQEMVFAAWESIRPVVLFKPSLSVDGNQYCFLLGEDLQSGVAGFGDTADAAARDFDKNFREQRIPKDLEKAREA